MSWANYFGTWGWAISKQRRIGSISLLCLLCAPMVWGIYIYHIYLVWAGMTTNENNKWSRWRDDIADGLVYKLARDQAHQGVSNGETRGSMEAKQVDGFTQKGEVERSEIPQSFKIDPLLLRTEDGRPPKSREQGHVWRRVSHISEVDNIYDLGFWNNLRAIFLTRKF